MYLFKSFNSVKLEIWKDMEFLKEMEQARVCYQQANHVYFLNGHKIVDILVFTDRV